MRFIVTGLTALLLFAGLAACSSASPDGAEQHADPPPQSENQIEKTPDIAPETPQAKPVTLTMSTHFPIDEEFNRLYVEPLKKVYPNINLRLLQGNNLTVIDQYLVAGQVPDLYLTYNGNLPGFFDRGLAYDMTDLMKTYNVDLGRFHQNYVDDIRFAVDGQEGLYGLPISTTFHALYYNKDIFDEFGTAYPKPGLTWDDMHTLAQSLTRLENGMQYRGYDFYNITRLAQPLGLEYVDRQTEKAIVNTDQWRKVFQVGKDLYAIPGNEPAADSKLNGQTGFLDTRNVAMYTTVNIFQQLFDERRSDLNWDVTQHPYYEENPNVFGNASVYLVGVSKTTSHTEEAFQVMAFFASDDVQMNLSKSGTVSTLVSPEIMQAFASDHPKLKDKNVTEILLSRPVKYPIYVYRTKSEQIVMKHFNEVLKGTVDINTALRKAEEEINIMVEAEKK